jgi:hypothetical protein
MPPPWVSYLNEVCFFGRPTRETRAAFEQSLPAGHSLLTARGLEELLPLALEAAPTVEVRVPRDREMLPLPAAFLVDWMAREGDWAECEAHWMPLDGVRGLLCFEVIEGLLMNTLPVVLVPSLLEKTPRGPVTEAILEYARGGPRELLYEAREQLIHSSPSTRPRGA